MAQIRWRVKHHNKGSRVVRNILDALQRGSQLMGTEAYWPGDEPGFQYEALTTYAIQACEGL